MISADLMSKRKKILLFMIYMLIARARLSKKLKLLMNG